LHEMCSNTDQVSTTYTLPTLVPRLSPLRRGRAWYILSRARRQG